MRLFHLLAVLVFLWSISAFSENQNSNQKALDETVQFLKDPSARKDFISKDKKAKQADDYAGQVAGTPEMKNEIYNLASEVFKSLGERNKLDPDKMDEELEKAQRDPASFADKFTPEQRVKLKELSDKLGKSKSIQ